MVISTGTSPDDDTDDNNHKYTDNNANKESCEGNRCNSKHVNGNRDDDALDNGNHSKATGVKKKGGRITAMKMIIETLQLTVS